MRCNYKSNFVCKRMFGAVPLPKYEIVNPLEKDRSYSSVWAGDGIGTGHARSMIGSPQAWSAQHNQDG